MNVHCTKKIRILFFLLGVGLLMCFTSPPNWVVIPSNYQYNMNGVIRIVNLNNTFHNDPNTMIAAFVNNEIRGVVDSTDIIFVNNEAYFPITIYANTQSGELLNFMVYDGSNDTIYQAVETAIFNRFELLGTPSNPFILTIGQCNDVLILDENSAPYRDFYKARQEIILNGTIDWANDTLLLSSPLVSATGLLTTNNFSLINIDSIGCE